MLSSTSHGTSIISSADLEAIVFALIDDESASRARQPAPATSGASSAPPATTSASSSASQAVAQLPTPRPEVPLDLCAPELELADPSPDLRMLFTEFDRVFFDGQLESVDVKWGKASMTLCAGLCEYYPGGQCSIRLSPSLLRLRPRSDTINTLLHEMIHAYLFRTRRDRDRDGHGRDFQNIMREINERARTNITVYHTFHDEVDVHRTHWWKCNGPCQERPPYYGVVKRAMNRPPGPRDPWYAEHKATCGGTYTKIKEPEPKARKRARGEEKEGDEGKRKDRGKGMVPLDAFLRRPDDVAKPTNHTRPTVPKGGGGNVGREEVEWPGGEDWDDGGGGQRKDGSKAAAKPDEGQRVQWPEEDWKVERMMGKGSQRPATTVAAVAAAAPAAQVVSSDDDEEEEEVSFLALRDQKRGSKPSSTTQAHVLTSSDDE